MQEFFIFLLLGTALNLWAQNFTPEHIEKLNKLKNITYEDLAHIHKGCPENSICSEKMGIKIGQWQKMALLWEKAQTQQQKRKLVHPLIEKYGHPIKFLANAQVGTKLDAAMWNSRCSLHRPKNGMEMFESVQFLTHTQHPDLVFTKVFFPATQQTFHLPYGERPIMLDQNKLIVALEFLDVHFYISIDQAGQIEEAYYPKNILEHALNQTENIENCPHALSETDKKWFAQNYCLNIWDVQNKKTTAVAINWSCP